MKHLYIALVLLVPVSLNGMEAAKVEQHAETAAHAAEFQAAKKILLEKKADENIRNVVLTNDGKLIATHTNGTAKVWNYNNGELIAIITQPGKYYMPESMETIVVE